MRLPRHASHGYLLPSRCRIFASRCLKVSGRSGSAPAWIAFVAITFGVLNAGIGHEAERELEHKTSLDAGDVIDGVRMLYTDSGDPRRYFAYGRAVLGRPYSGYFVRSAAGWRREFDEGRERDPDLFPDLVPAQPLVPYRDFAVEYPPLIFPIFVPLAAAIDDADGFRFAFGVEMALVLALALRLGLRLARRLATTIPPSHIVGWTAAAALMLGGVVTHRFDACVSLAIVASLVAAAEDRPGWTGAALGLAVGLKLVPVVIVPIVALRWIVDHRWRALARGIAAGAVVVAVALGPLVFVGDDGLAAILRYHAGRPLQVESTWAAALRLLSLIDGSSVAVVHSYGSVNIAGTHATAALALAPIALVAGLGGMIALAWRCLAHASTEAQRNLIVIRGTIAALAIVMTLGKVFSPQYLVWLLPLGVIVALADGRRSIATITAILVLTQIIYPIGNPALQSGQIWVSALVLVRNLALLGWAVAPLLLAHRRRGDRSTQHAQRDEVVVVAEGLLRRDEEPEQRRGRNETEPV
jgi:glycosyl transferase family 87